MLLSKPVFNLGISCTVWQSMYYDVDGLLDDPVGLIIFPVEDLYPLHGDLVAWPPIKKQVFRHH